MATQLTLVNNVLRRLREDTVTSVADNAYSQLIAMFINDGIQETNEAYDWSSLRHEIEFDIASGTLEYDLSLTVANGGNVVNTGRVTTADSMLRFDPRGRALAFIYDDSTEAQGDQLNLITEDMRYMKSKQDTSTTVDEPMHFSLSHASTGDGFILRLWPEPSAASYGRITFWTPQAELTIDGTDDSTEIIVPNKVVEAYAHMATSNERGEEIGEPGNLLERRWQRVLGGAIEAAMNADGYADRYVSWRD
jgi:hypothetical protein